MQLLMNRILWSIAVGLAITVKLPRRTRLSSGRFPTSVPSPKSLELRRRSVGCFSRHERSAAIWIITVERATQKNSQLAAARRVALKMGRLLRCSSVTYRSRYAPLAPVRLGPPRRRPILNATKFKGFRRRYTSVRSVRWLRSSGLREPDHRLNKPNLRGLYRH